MGSEISRIIGQTHTDQPEATLWEFSGGASPRLKEQLGSNLSPLEAVTEVIDNSVGYRNDRDTIAEPITHITLTIDHKNNTVKFDQLGGTGVQILDQEAIEGILRLGHSTGHSIGKFGFGLPSAMWRLRPTSGQLVIKAPHEAVEYVTDLTEYADITIPLHNSRIRTFQRPVGTEEDLEQARFSMQLNNIDEKVMKELQTDAIYEAIAERYAPTLSVSQEDQIQTPRYNPETRQWYTSFNQVVIRLHEITPEGARRQRIIRPGHIDLEVGQDDERRYTPNDLSNFVGIADDGTDFQMPFWAGVMEKPAVAQARETDPGMRFYYDGILLAKDELLGRGRRSEEGDILRQLYGEFYVDAYPDIRDALRINKASSIDWRRGGSRIMREVAYEALVSYGIIDYVRSRREQKRTEASRPTFLREAASKAHAILHTVFTQLVNEHIFDEEFLELCLIELGQREPVPTNNHDDPGVDPQPTGTTRVGVKWPDQQPRTLLPEDAAENRPRKRFGVYHDVQYAPLGQDPKIVSQLQINQGRTILILNDDNPFVRYARLQDKVFLYRDPKASPYHSTLLIAEQIAQHLLDTYMEGLPSEISKDPGIIFEYYNQIRSIVADELLKERYLRNLAIEMETGLPDILK